MSYSLSGSEDAGLQAQSVLALPAERLADEALARAIGAAEAGLIDADLGGGLIKQRVARAGRGKSGGYRTRDRVPTRPACHFPLGFAKSERDNIDDDELEEWRKVAKAYLGLDTDGINAAIRSNEMKEVHGEEENEGQR
jgi:hypothetical protein